MIEWELDPVTMARTGRWRRRQFYALPGMPRDERPLSERTPCEWRGDPDLMPPGYIAGRTIAPRAIGATRWTLRP